MFSSARYACATLFPPKSSIYTQITRRLTNLGLRSSLSFPAYKRSNQPQESVCSNLRMGSLCAIDEPMQYPHISRDESVVDNYHGVLISDPYRWLEDPDAEEVKDFVEKQVKLTESLLQKCDTREKLREKITELFDHPRYNAPFRRGDKYFYFHNTGLQAQDVLYMQDSLDGEPQVLLDPNGLSEDGTVSLNIYDVSKNAKYLGYGLSSSGSDWIKEDATERERGRSDRSQGREGERESSLKSKGDWIVEVEGDGGRRRVTGLDRSHEGRQQVDWTGSKSREGENLDAGTETNVNLNHEVYYHFLGTDQSEDILCWRDSENPKYSFGTSVTDDGKYLLLYTAETCEPVNKVYYCDMSALANGLEGYRGRKDLLPFVKLIDNFDAEYGTIANDNTIFIFRTNKDAPKYKLVRVDLKKLKRMCLNQLLLLMVIKFY
ncbi:hypothetical protein TEA_014678 [Camellia sinensis var. sinensis]|uniref:Peptidase S9A N-terminal domain-containing protein n=1 Tax=Camellia sinensis var. sinensis TaxID=542762 RepID=A0A4S4DW38_CAMSN|nr:hypothetical protein TEA_014678 [Camellia sinensis var. sinensis]